MTEALRDDGEWSPIASAPKDGTLILLTAIEEDGTLFEVWPMQWMHIQRNALFPGVTGMWTSPFYGFTWNGEPGDGGPTHWRPGWRNPTAEELERARQKWGDRDSGRLSEGEDPSGAECEASQSGDSVAGASPELGGSNG